VVITPKHENYKGEGSHLKKGKPPFQFKNWNKVALAEALSTLEGTKNSHAFVKKVIELGNSPYQHPSGILKMYQKWKLSRTALPRGRPILMTVGEAERAVEKVLKKSTTPSSVFQISDLKTAYASKLKERAARNGLDPDSINVKVSDQLVKTTMLAAAMSADVGTFTTNKLLLNTELRFLSKHSLAMGYSHATTVLSTHVIKGNASRSLSK
jgi:hypothetical protein